MLEILELCNGLRQFATLVKKASMELLCLFLQDSQMTFHAQDLPSTCCQLRIPYFLKPAFLPPSSVEQNPLKEGRNPSPRTQPNQETLIPVPENRTCSDCFRYMYLALYNSLQLRATLRFTGAKVADTAAGTRTTASAAAAASPSGFPKSF